MATIIYYKVRHKKDYMSICKTPCPHGKLTGFSAIVNRVGSHFCGACDNHKFCSPDGTKENFVVCDHE